MDADRLYISRNQAYRGYNDDGTKLADIGTSAEYSAVIKQLHSSYGASGNRNLGLYSHRLSEQPLKKYRRDEVVPFKTRLVGTLARMQKEGGHSSELLESISNLIGEDNA